MVIIGRGCKKKYFNFNVPVIGICVRHKKDIQVDKVYEEAKKTCEKLRCNILDKSDVIVYDEYIGPGYGEPTKEMIEATKLLAKKEAILLDPVYSGTVSYTHLTLPTKA